MKTTGEKCVLAVYAICVIQFIGVFIYTATTPAVDKKLLLTLSAVGGLVISSAVRQMHHAYKLEDSTKPLDEQTLKEMDKE